VTISTHVLDTSIGRPAAGLRVQLLRVDAMAVTAVSSADTNADGRVAALLPAGSDARAGAFRLVFDVAGYFAGRGQETFYTTVAIDFLVRDAAQHYHVPLLVSPFGYSTYRGT
jgi:5-hydroxyisourate hydrolase